LLPVLHAPLLDLDVRAYGFVLAVYFVLALALTVQLNEYQGIGRRYTLAAFAVGVPAGIVGARLLDIVEYSTRYQFVTDAIGRSGSSIYGGFLLNFAVTVLYLVSRGISPLAFLDAGAPAMALGEAMSRIGCFLNGCCYGIASTGPLAVTFPTDSFAFRDQTLRGVLADGASRSLGVHPVQLYSAVAMSVVTALLLVRFYKDHRRGDVFWMFLIAYGCLRLLIAPFRVEVLRSMVVFSVMFIAVGTLGLLRSRHGNGGSSIRAVRG
jgi:phosphatidylglycerol:prolipoprotein diacylglycerol transferase